MQYFWCLLVPILLINTAYAKQPSTYAKMRAKLEALSDQQYEERKNKEQADVSKMYFFVKHVDEVGTPEKALLDAYLWGLQEAFSVNQQWQHNQFKMAWFRADLSLLNGMNDNKAVEKIIRWVYTTYPENFEKNGIYSSSSSALAFGLQRLHHWGGIPMERISGYTY